MFRYLAIVLVVGAANTPAVAAARQPSIPPVLCTTGKGKVRLLANADEACAEITDVAERDNCTAEWSSKDARRAGRQLGIIVAKINAQLQQHEVDTYAKLKNKTQSAPSSTSTTPNTTTDGETTTGGSNATNTNTTDPTDSEEPFDVVEEPPAELNLTDAETAEWKSAAATLKGRRGKGPKKPKEKSTAGGFTQHLAYVCHTVDVASNAVTLYMKMNACSDADFCDAFDDVE